MREIAGRYKGSLIGVAWSFVTPILMLTVYTFVFSVVFKVRWGIVESENNISFAIILFIGLIIHGLFAEVINRAPSLIVSNRNYVKKVIFPLEILPLVALGTAFFHSIISFLVLIVTLGLNGSQLHITIIFLPFLIIPLLLLILGATWFLASLGVYFLDISQFTGLMTTLLMFLSPIFYPISAVPEKIQTLMLLNPLTFVVEQSRGVILGGNFPDWEGLAIYTLLSVLFAYLGYYWFQKTRRGFGDVL